MTNIWKLKSKLKDLAQKKKKVKLEKNFTLVKKIEKSQGNIREKIAKLRKLKKLRIKNDKKGAITDVIMWVVTAIVVVLFLGLLFYAFGTKVFPALKTGFSSFQNVHGQNLTNYTNQVADITVTSMTNSWNWIAYGVLIAMALNILLGYFLVRIHPAFFVLYFLFAIIGFVVSLPVSNFYENLLNSGSEFATILSTQFKGASFIMLHLPIWVCVISFVGAIILFAGIPKDKGLGGGPTA